MELADVIPSGSGLQLRQGVVDSVVGTKYVHIHHAGGVLRNAGKLDADTYAAGDLVWFLLDNEAGALVLGKQAAGVHGEVPPGVGSPLIVDDNAYATYDTVTGIWTASTLVQSPTQYACWFYTTSAFAALEGAQLASFELEVTRTGGGPPEIGPHLNGSASGVLVTTGETWVRDQLAQFAPTWLPLPIDWGMRLVSGAIKGLAVGGQTYSGMYSGTGRVRLTPV